MSIGYDPQRRLYGSSSVIVTNVWLQRALNAAGSALSVDGIAGPMTRAALVAFARAARVPLVVEYLVESQRARIGRALESALALYEAPATVPTSPPATEPVPPTAPPPVAPQTTEPGPPASVTQPRVARRISPFLSIGAGVVLGGIAAALSR